MLKLIAQDLNTSIEIVLKLAFSAETLVVLIVQPILLSARAVCLGILKLGKVGELDAVSATNLVLFAPELFKKTVLSARRISLLASRKKYAFPSSPVLTVEAFLSKL